MHLSKDHPPSSANNFSPLVACWIIVTEAGPKQLCIVEVILQTSPFYSWFTFKKPRIDQTVACLSIRCASICSQDLDETW